MGEPIEKPLGGTGCLFRLYWMFGGNIILLFLVIFLIDKRFKFPSWLDLVCLITVITLIAVRYIDIRYMLGETAEGKPASMSDFRSYTLILVIVSSLMWAVALVLR
ncbi:MAG: hypothetical protein PHR77_21630 [Kiritimatiellae bacterium]|nr:hypothetical protein [Kiritimatiellia bacterium]MDD5523128.1 hypothetical protein [Kiritimatiellia bacterium]